MHAQVCTELENHVGIGDKTLAEFIIDLADETDGLPAFQRKLEENGAEFPDSFTVSLHALIMRLKPKKVRSRLALALTFLCNCISEFVRLCSPHACIFL